MTCHWPGQWHVSTAPPAGPATAPAKSYAPHHATSRDSLHQVISKRMVKNDKCAGVPAEHLLLQIRIRILNDTFANDCRRWYPNFTHTAGQDNLAA